MKNTRLGINANKIIILKVYIPVDTGRVAQSV